MNKFAVIVFILSLPACRVVSTLDSINNLERPIRVQAISAEDDDNVCSVLLVGSDGTLVAISGRHDTGRALCGSAKVGDVIGKFNNEYDYN